MRDGEKHRQRQAERDPEREVMRQVRDLVRLEPESTLAKEGRDLLARWTLVRTAEKEAQAAREAEEQAKVKALEELEAAARAKALEELEAWGDSPEVARFSELLGTQREVLLGEIAKRYGKTPGEVAALPARDFLLAALSLKAAAESEVKGG